MDSILESSAEWRNAWIMAIVGSIALFGAVKYSANVVHWAKKVLKRNKGWNDKVSYGEKDQYLRAVEALRKFRG